MDVLFIVANSMGIELTLPAWVYGAILGLGFVWENIRIYSELEAKNVEANLVCGIYSGNPPTPQSWADAISFKIPHNPDFRPTFGIVITTDKPGTFYKGVSVSLSCSWIGEPLNKGITIRPPRPDDRWQEIQGQITNESSAIFKYTAPDEVVTNGSPLLLQHLTFHVVEHLKGSILIKCGITGLDPRASRNSELVINIAPESVG